MDRTMKIIIEVSNAQGKFHSRLREISKKYNLELSEKAWFNAINIAGDILLNQLKEKKELDKITLQEMVRLILKHCLATKCEYCPLLDTEECGVSDDEEKLIRNYTKLRDSGSFENDRELRTE